MGVMLIVFPPENVFGFIFLQKKCEGTIGSSFA